MSTPTMLIEIPAVQSDISPNMAQIYYITPGGGSGTDVKILVDRFALWAVSAVSDATTYYAGVHPPAYLYTTAGLNRIRVLAPGIIKRVFLDWNFVAGSNTPSSIWIRKNNATDYLLTNALNFSSSPLSLNITGLSIPLADGDYFEFKWTTPTWPTNPTNIYGWATTYLEKS